MSEITIRRAEPADAASLSEIGAFTFVETFGHLYPPGDLAAFLAEAYDLQSTLRDLNDSRKASWLVEQDGRVVGYGSAGPCGLPHEDVGPRSLELKRFYLIKACQSGGIGGRLWAEIMAWMSAQAPTDLWIGVWSENFGAQRFYARQGFTKVGEYGFAVGSTVDREFILRRVCAQKF